MKSLITMAIIVIATSWVLSAGLQGALTLL